MTEKVVSKKAKFAWASIAGAQPEPVEIIDCEGRIGVLTTGCPDPFWLDDKSASVRLDWDEMDRPQSIQTQKERDAANRKYLREMAARGGFHGWRGSR